MHVFLFSISFLAFLSCSYNSSFKIFFFVSFNILVCLAFNLFETINIYYSILIFLRIQSFRCLIFGSKRFFLVRFVFVNRAQYCCYYEDLFKIHICFCILIVNENSVLLSYVLKMQGMILFQGEDQTTIIGRYGQDNSKEEQVE